MSQPYDLSGIAALQATIAQMVADQTSGAVKFAGGAQTWLPSPAGWFLAILAAGGSMSPTTTTIVRTALKAVRTTLDLIAGGTGTAAAHAVQANTPPSFLLETGRSPTGPQTATGPVVNGATSVAATSYDLSGVAALQTTANAMLADMQSGGTVFADSTPFQAILLPGGAAQSTNIRAVLMLFAAITAQFDFLDL
jgi:hypothetical protein